ncbi:S46 family peptidase [Aliidiomarina quisquiliarum]|uniref:S46 family peptidase n=1 Tax=Aliidiomarina quisquiliarum TaxID=2938947 RepID=UPI00208DE19A|nr:S46 family peptidase [Aliidiomarina quisquiliarum]MCO4322274.1 S46 family peptidase [Aliidiomarina quisquiliarum]
MTPLIQRLFIAAGALALMPIVSASEGMWLASEQPELAQNIPLTAVARVGACSGVFVSEQGLLLTNAHCIEETMQLRSDEQHKIRDQGFLARTLAEELPAAPGFFASITLSQQDVTARMLKNTYPTMAPRDRHLHLTRNRNALLRACEAEPNVNCQVQEHQDGLHYLLVRERQLRDVRLVYVAPAAVAMYGGDAANWQWPRFAADIAVMRVYVAPNGNAADFAASNVPYQPVEVAQVADSHLTFFDAVRVAGYPGTTQRFRTAAEMQWAFSEQYPAMLTYLQDFEQIIATYVGDDSQLKVRFQPTLFRLRNQITNIEAQLNEYQQHGLQQESEKSQEQLLTWLALPERQEQYGGAWWIIQQQLQENRQWLPQQLWWHFLQELSLPGAALLVHRYAYEQSIPEDIRARGFQQRDIYSLRAQLDNYANRIDLTLEQNMLVHLLMRYLALPEPLQSQTVMAFFSLSSESTESSIRSRVAELYKAPKLLDDEVRQGWFSKSLVAVENSYDPWLQFATATATERLAIDAREIESRGRIAFARPRMMAAQREYDQAQGRVLPANANRTLRISEGQVLGYRPDPDPNNFRLALTYLDVFRDHLQAEKDSNLPSSFRRALTRHGKKCFINQARGSVTVNFISTADGALGSSGAPTFDSQGHLVGLVFDLMAESTMSDWIYARNRHRLVHVDIRYLLWILGYYEGATELLAELGFTDSKPQQAVSCRVKPLLTP